MPRISVDRLRPGVFISLVSLGWMGHPFLLNRFCLSSEKQIQALREMGITEIEWDPARSTAEPLPPRAANLPAPEPDFGTAALAGMQDEKRARIERVREQREGLARRERLFEQQAVAAGDVFRSLLSRPQDAQRQANALVGSLVENLLGNDSMVIHLVNQKSREGGLAFHALNVMALSLMLGKTLGLSEEEMRHLGLGALLHDIGKQEIPPRILRNARRTGPEEDFYRAHVGYGIKAVSNMRDLPVPVRNVIACHHEFFDGSGFPNRLAGEKIPRLARIAAIANRYDNLCNPFDLREAKAPAEALRQIFRAESKHYDEQLVQLFIRTLGVYPPGTFVALSNGGVGMVVETNPANLLHPLVMLHDPDIPRSEAMLVDLRDADLKVEAALSPATLPVETVEYLAPRGRLDYFVDGSRN
ncbi:HD domain-containing phosphohydrolase [Aromatoleum evansii]|uniref:HD domain-containing phosphohydrolase n=1 Tax=Aromatoleum evansii TaxID=59406 RepID=A0ABZ1AKN6_AROEV|nr:HD domain-containing phosphohydrolase [Aromatoleum evansii]